jgi:hypothetical protein
VLVRCERSGMRDAIVARTDSDEASMEGRSRRVSHASERWAGWRLACALTQSRGPRRARCAACDADVRPVTLGR